MRLLVISHEFPPIGGGGGRAAQDICQGLVERGYQIQVLTAHYRGLPKQETSDNLVIHRIASFRSQAFRAGLFAMGGFVIASTLAGFRLVRHWKPDLLHIHFAVPSGAVGWMINKVTGIPYVLTAHLGDVPGGVPEKTKSWFKLVAPLTPPIWKNAVRVVAVSDFTRQLALARYPVEIQVIPNGVDLTKVTPGTIQVNHPPRIVFAGRFMPQKNLVQLVRSLAEVKHLPWVCTLIGDGPLRQDIEVEVGRLNLETRISFTGWVTPEQVIEVFSQSDILFMPSLSEGLPVVGVQALASGLAIVSSDVGGWLDIVSQGVNGFLVSNQNPQGYTEALEYLLVNPARLGDFRLSSRTKASQFDLSNVVDAYDIVFTQLLERSSRP